MKTEQIIKYIITIFGIYLVYQLYRKITGNSWSTDGIIIGLIILNLGWTVAMQKQISSHIGEHKGYKEGYKNGKGYKNSPTKLTNSPTSPSYT